MLILAIDTSAVASAALVTDVAVPSVGDRREGAGRLVADQSAASQRAAGRHVADQRAADPPPAAHQTPGPRVLAEFVTEDTRSHAEVLAPGIRRMLDDAGIEPKALDAVVVGVGPGPFTGLRSGIVTARTLSFAWNVPLHGIMSLDAVARRVAADEAVEHTEFLVAIDARRKEVYWASYRMANEMPELVEGPHIGPAAQLPALPVYGAGAGLYADVVDAVEGYATTQPEAAPLGEMALIRLAAGVQLPNTTPLYLRESDAKVPGPRKRATGVGR